MPVYGLLMDSSRNWKMRVLLASIVLAVLSLALVLGDYFIYAMDAMAGWPPDPATMGLIKLLRQVRQRCAGSYLDSDLACRHGAVGPRCQATFPFT